MSKPFVSVITPTYNRRRFILALIECVKHQDYPADRIEWIILDDGEDKVRDLFERIGLNNVRYYSHHIKLNIGAKRNRLNMLAKGDIIVCMDDDDYYPPQRISHAVDTLGANSSFQICGSSELYLYFTDEKSIYNIGPYSDKHATNGTLAYRRSYLENHSYDETVKNGEESSFLNNFTEPMIQLEPYKVVLLISHSENTFDKRRLRVKQAPVFRETPFSLRQFINDDRLYTLYNNI
jgi:glycosyltransferase involved in cell wall biosynthesis